MPTRVVSSNASLPALDGWIDEFLSFVEFEKGLSRNTIDAYRRDLAVWRKYCAARGLDATAIVSKDITDYLDRLRKGKAPASVPYSPASVARMLVAVRALHKFLTREGQIEVDPFEIILGYASKL